MANNMQILVINLDIRTDRMTYMSQQLDALGLEYTRIPAINGLGELDINYPDNHPRLAKAEYACYLSHVKCWKYIVANNLNHCLILEDDVQLSPNLADALERTELFSHERGVTRLETLNGNCYVRPSPVVESGRFSVHISNTYTGGAGAYIVNRKSAQKYLSRYPEPLIPIDDQIFYDDIDWAGRTNIPQLVPGLAIQRVYFNPDTANGVDTSNLITVRQEKLDEIESTLTAKSRIERRLRKFLFRIFKRFGYNKVKIAFDIEHVET